MNQGLFFVDVVMGACLTASSRQGIEPTTLSVNKKREAFASLQW
jgi:hypothetical protein